jgi:tetratricopeptide (TPR) repeat protein
LKNRISIFFAFALTGILLSACAQLVPVVEGLYEGFGDYHRAMTTDSEEAQALFDQGLQLMYGFNHDEAIRSFQAAAEKDPKAAMPWWGIAYSHGININDPEMTEERSKAAREAADNALERMANSTPQETALINAVSARYNYPAPADRSGLDQAFADAMEDAYEQFPEDPEVETIFADSLMNLQPWDYWENDGSPKGRVEEIVSVLEATRAASRPSRRKSFLHSHGGSI